MKTKLTPIPGSVVAPRGFRAAGGLAEGIVEERQGARIRRGAALSAEFSVEQALAMPVSEVNVHVQGVRVSNDD